VIVIPAVDLRDGRCVRLRQGRSDRETVFSEDPIAMAVRWKRLGAERLHVVDLDGAFAGEPRQTALVARIVAAVSPLPVQVGGGLRDLEAVGRALETGARWAVVGTRAALDPEFLREVCRAWPARVIVAVDGRGSHVVVRGWTETLSETVTDVGTRARDAAAAALLYTDVTRDGTGIGPNVDATATLARAVALPVLASGGVARLDDLRRLAEVPGVEGCVVGHALYTGGIDLPEALRELAHAPVAGHRRSEPSSRPPASAAGHPPIAPGTRTPLQ
jgi:phosphoribosylformimino-5-aminoimidazole carboxamide ribotide isomerase